MELLDTLVALLTLIVLEVVLGIDNIIFISILADRLPPKQRDRLRRLGLVLAMVIRLGLLALLSIIMKLDTDLFTVLSMGFSGKDIILIVGGGFLLVKATREIFHMTEQARKSGPRAPGRTKGFNAALVQVLLLDMVFSIDSILTAVGLVDQLWMMYTAVVITVVIMLIASKPIAGFITKHPSFKVLALAFLMVIGVALFAEGMGQHLPKGYIYGPMAFAFFVDVMQMRVLREKGGR